MLCCIILLHTVCCAALFWCILYAVLLYFGAYCMPCCTILLHTVCCVALFCCILYAVLHDFGAYCMLCCIILLHTVCCVALFWCILYAVLHDFVVNRIRLLASGHFAWKSTINTKKQKKLHDCVSSKQRKKHDATAISLVFYARLPIQREITMKLNCDELRPNMV